MLVGRRLLTGVYPPDLAEGTWSSLVQETLSRLLGDQIEHVSWNLPPEIDDVDPHRAITAYRIVIEAVRNALRHGQAKQVVVCGSLLEDTWHVDIGDNGSGFDVSAIPSDRFGVRVMIGRAQLVGGSLRIDSQPGGPTTVKFRFPAR